MTGYGSCNISFPYLKPATSRPAVSHQGASESEGVSLRVFANRQSRLLQAMCQVAYLRLGCCKGIYFGSYDHIAHTAACQPGVRNMIFCLTMNDMFVICSMLVNLNTYLSLTHGCLSKNVNVTRQQSITWANVDPDLCHHVASLGHSVHHVFICHYQAFLAWGRTGLQSFWACCAMAQIISKYLNKPLGYWVIFCEHYNLWLAATRYDMICKNEIINHFLNVSRVSNGLWLRFVLMGCFLLSLLQMDISH